LHHRLDDGIVVRAGATARRRFRNDHGGPGLQFLTGAACELTVSREKPAGMRFAL
jgi:hypothetical protein